jgi:hypothetical protein
VEQNFLINHIDKGRAEIPAQSRVVGMETKDEIYEQDIVKSPETFFSRLPGIPVW